MSIRFGMVGLAACVSCAACTGTIGGTEAGGTDNQTRGAGALGTGAQNGTGPASVNPDAASPGPAGLRRLTATEYRNTVADLLPFVSPLGDAFIAEVGDFGFDTTAATTNLVSDAVGQQYVDAASALAKVAVESALARLVPCSVQGATDGCARQFIDQFGRRAWRRPLESDEQARLFTVFTTVRSDAFYGANAFAMGIRTVLEAVLQSPNFLYRVELPSDPTQPVADYEMASRLSYLLWRTMPDDLLFSAASSGGLRTQGDIKAQAKRMMSDAKAQAAMRLFYAQWFSLDRVLSVSKSPSVFPKWSADVGALFQQEAQLLFDDVLWNQGGDVRKLFTESHTFVNAPLASYYGLPGVSGSGFARVEVPAEQRAGVMRLGAVMAGLAHSETTSPFGRAKFILDRLVCQPLPPPPPAVNMTVPAAKPNETTRQILARLTSPAQCQSCHGILSPYGFAFEAFDAAGRWRTTDNGSPVDTAVDFKSGLLQGPISGAPELMQRLSETSEVESCSVLNAFRYSFGRGELDGDAPALQWLAQGIAADHDLRAVFSQLVDLPEFRFRGM